MKQTVLVVEDDKFLRDVLVEKLMKEGFEVLSAMDGRTALALTGTKAPDIVILDVIVPDMNGFDYLEAKAEDAAIAKIPVIILSNLGQKEDVERGLALGAKDYMVKAHFTPNDLLAKIRSLI